MTVSYDLRSPWLFFTSTSSSQNTNHERPNSSEMPPKSCTKKVRFGIKDIKEMVASIHRPFFCEAYSGRVNIVVNN